MLFDNLPSTLLLALEIRLAFFEEGPNALATILRMKALHLLLDFLIESFLQLIFPSGKENSFDGLDRERGPLRDFLRQRFHFGLQLRRGHHAADYPQPQRGLRIDQISGIKHFSRGRRPGELRKKKRSAIIRKQAYAGETLAERGHVRGDTDIRRKR